MNEKLPHPIPYQGSKRQLAPMIHSVLPADIETFYEPFAGSAAMTLYAAHHGLAKRFVVGDCLPPIVNLWQAIIDGPEDAARKYREVWSGQSEENQNYYNEVRDRFNQLGDPIDLLYLICRCVKNAVRFGSSGKFTQSRDKRRLGMNPSKMSDAMLGASGLLRGKVEFRIGDWLKTTDDARTCDFLYMDPPYLGTTIGRDKRYHQQLELEALIGGLSSLNSRQLRFALSYDGMTGAKSYGAPLPESLEMTQLLLHAGRSSQATLQGKDDETVESLYLSKGLVAPAQRRLGRGTSLQQTLSI